MQGAGLDLAQVGIDRLHEAVAVGVLALPAVTALTDDEANGSGIGICVNGSHHFAVLFHEGSGTGDGTPGEQIPLIVGTVFPDVMEFQGHGTGFLSGNAEHTGNHHKTQNHHDCQKHADRLFHVDPPIQFSSYVL